MGDIRGVDFRLVISQSNGLLINVDRRPYRLKTKAYNHDYSATVKTCHTADVYCVTDWFGLVYYLKRCCCSARPSPCPGGTY